MAVKRTALNKNEYIIVFFLILGLSVFLMNCGGSESGSKAPNHPEKITIMQTSVSIGDPHICSDSTDRLSVIFNIYEALIELDKDGNYQPLLAESWLVEEDGLTWIFKLRDGVRFHNEDILDAEDVVATLGRVLDPAIGGAFGTQGVYISYLGNAEISAINSHTVQIVTEEPMADLLDLLVAMPICPKKELNNLPHEYVGSGPYQVSDRSDNQMILKVHEEYWGKTPEYKEIHWIAESDSEKKVQALMSGQADIASGISIQDAEKIKQTEGDTTICELKSGLCIIFMCNAQKGPCQDRRIRQALNYAVNGRSNH